MKTMKCKPLGGACEKEFHANSFEEMAEQSKQHGMQMIQKGDQAHLLAMQKMKELVSSPESMQKWFEDKRKQYNLLPEL